MKFFALFLLVSGAFAADVIDPSTCVTYPCLVFEDTFDFLDHDVWEHEITAAGGGNFEFEAFVNNRSISYTKNGVLYIKPALTSEWQSEEFLTSGTLNLWNQNGRGEVCTGNLNNGCEQVGTPTQIINPILSARLRTLSDFAVRFARIEIVAKMPRGEWLWPAVWMLPQYFKNGPWPASGEIDIIESRGNNDSDTLSNTYAGSTLHWGPYSSLNRYYLTTNFYQTADGSSFADNFHTWALEWTNTDMRFYLDDVLQLTIDPGTSFWDFGGFDAEGDLDNIWTNSKMTPFDEKFYFVLNLAVGGTGGFFPDGAIYNPPKPWSNTSPTARADFWNDKDNWFPSWTEDGVKISENAALQIDSIRVYKQSAD